MGRISLGNRDSLSIPYPCSQPLHLESKPHRSRFSPWMKGHTASEGACPSSVAASFDNAIAAYGSILSLSHRFPNHAVTQSRELPFHIISSDPSGIPEQPMPPPAINPRKRKASTLRPDDWIPVKARIIELHIDENMPLPEVKDIIEEEFPFQATLRQYRSAITNWGLDKNIKKNVMQAIVRKRLHRQLAEPQKKDLKFQVHSVVVKSEKIETWMKRNNVSGDAMYAPSPAASTPSELRAWTPSDVASSPIDESFSLHTPIAMTLLSPECGHSNIMRPPTASPSNIFHSPGSEFRGQSPAVWTTDDKMPTHIYRSEDEVQLRLQLFRSREQSNSEDSDVLGIEFELGEVLHDQGRYRSAEGIFRRLISRCYIIYGKEHENTLKAMNSLGRVVFNQGLFSKATNIFQECLEIRKASLGLDHPDTLTSMSCLADVLLCQGNYSMADAMQRQALELRIQVLGVEHPATLYSMRRLANALAHQGNYSEANLMHRLEFESSIRVNGAEHLSTIFSMMAVAHTLGLQGSYFEAEEMYRQISEVRTTVSGEEHPDTLTCKFSVALMVSYQGRFSEAYAIHCWVLKLRVKVLGAEHPSTLFSKAAVGIMLAFQGHLSEAEEMHRQVLEVRTKVLGAKHPQTLESMFSLANVFFSQTRYSEAESMHRQVLEMRIRVLGPEHPNTVASREIVSTVA